MGELTRLVDNDIPAVGTNIGKQADRPGGIPDQHQGFIQKGLQQGEGVGVTGGRDQVDIADELPGRGEQLFFCLFE